jgi:uncharacterized cupin superfamily protein
MSEMKAYTRVVRTHDGGSAFEDAELDLTERRITEGVPPMLTGGMGASGAVTFLRSAAFGSEAHPAPRDQWVVMVRGAIEVQVSDGARRRFGPGDLVFVSDTTGRGHVTVGVGEPPFEALFVPVT